MHKEKVNRIRESNGDVISKSSYEVWNKFITWLRFKKVKVIKDFQEECQWKWQHDEIDDVLCVKINDK